MPEEGVMPIGHEQVLRFEEIIDVVKEGVKMGIDKVRITGGEPLVRKGIVDLVGMLSAISGIKDLAMTSNGILLDRYAEELAKAGLQRINISLDSMDPDTYHRITRRGRLDDVLRGIDAAEAAGLTPIKINCVVRESSDEADAQAVKAFAEARGFQVRFIHQMNLETGTFSKVEGGEGGDCAHCNRLRLTADGQILPCLFSEIGYPVRELGAHRALLKALENKPPCGSINTKGSFYTIGG